MIKPVVLWTDALLYVLLATAVVTAFYVRGKPHLAEPFRRVGQSPAGVAALVVLSAYVALGFMDSLHFRAALPPKPGLPRQYAVETLSLLDVALAPLRAGGEKTYSAPLAWQGLSKEAVEGPGGVEVRAYPRLAHGGAHLADPPRQWAGDVAWRAGLGLLLGLAVWGGGAVLLAAWRGKGSLAARWRALWRGEARQAARVALVTFGVLCVFAFPVAMLAAHYHVLGTDKVGQDVLYIALKSVRTALVIGTLATLIMLPFAVLLGIVAGYARGWVDDVVQYLYTTLNSIPGVLLIAAAVLMMEVWMEGNPALFDTVAMRADARLFFLCLILGVTNWTGLARLLRGEALKLGAMDYVEAARAFGVPGWRIVLRHLLPNVMHIVLISVVMDFSGLVLAEAVLSYVGVGVDPTTFSFGNMINGARLEMAREPPVWWTLAAAFAFMFALVLCANLFADAVRDAFDPRGTLRHYRAARRFWRKAGETER
jgi:peptide/nickel transport system permease protein